MAKEHPLPRDGRRSGTPTPAPAQSAAQGRRGPRRVEGIAIAPPAPARSGYLFAKRVIDVLGAAAGCLLCLPLWAVAAVLIKMESPGGVFHLQDRVGEGGQVFRFYKLRTMYVDAEKHKPLLADRNEMDGPVFKMRRDPRVTRVGSFLRRFSLDETPQLVHVLLGQMSLVGPRPPLLEEVLHYEPWHMERLSVRPGLTCTWQVTGRNEIPFDKWVQLDIEYIHHRNFWVDLGLLARTIPAVITGRGAY